MRIFSRRSFLALTFAVIAVPCALFVIPAPLSGYWHTPISECLCNSKNLLSFQDGVVYRWASGHGIVKEVSGTYERSVYWVKWHTPDGVVEIRPGWFLMDIRVPSSSRAGHTQSYWGFRELRPGYIREVLKTERAEPVKRPVGMPGDSPFSQPSQAPALLSPAP